jgi:hypothetical protein
MHSGMGSRLLNLLSRIEDSWNFVKSFIALFLAVADTLLAVLASCCQMGSSCRRQ